MDVPQPADTTNAAELQAAITAARAARTQAEHDLANAQTRIDALADTESALRRSRLTAEAELQEMSSLGSRLQLWRAAARTQAEQNWQAASEALRATLTDKAEVTSEWHAARSRIAEAEKTLRNAEAALTAVRLDQARDGTGRTADRVRALDSVIADDRHALAVAGEIRAALNVTLQALEEATQYARWAAPPPRPAVDVPGVGTLPDIAGLCRDGENVRDVLAALHETVTSPEHGTSSGDRREKALVESLLPLLDVWETTLRERIRQRTTDLERTANFGAGASGGPSRAMPGNARNV